MIFYDSGDWSARTILRWKGSVVPWAFVWALTAAVLEATLRNVTVLHDQLVNLIDASRDTSSLAFLWGGFTMVLGYLLSIRTNASYQRFWEGARLVYLVRGEWFNCVSSLLSFCSEDSAMTEEVQTFQNVLVRLASLLHCMALEHVCEVAEDSLEVLDMEGFEEESLVYLETVHDRCDVLVQWLQRLIVTARRRRVVDVADPILTRSFQELSRGVVNLNNVRRIKDIPFPYPYHQCIILALMIHWLATPLLACLYINSAALSTMLVFSGQAGLWALVYTAIQLDQPFGEDPNDLPMADLQQDFNRSLLSLLHPLSKQVPSYVSNHYDREASNHNTRKKHKTLNVDLATISTHNNRSTRASVRSGYSGQSSSPGSPVNPDAVQQESDVEVCSSQPSHHDSDIVQVDFMSDQNFIRLSKMTADSEDSSLTAVPRSRRPATLSPLSAPRPLCIGVERKPRDHASHEVIDAHPAQALQRNSSAGSQGSITLSKNPLPHKARNLGTAEYTSESEISLRQSTISHKARDLRDAATPQDRRGRSS